jgi:ferredoxin
MAAESDKWTIEVDREVCMGSGLCAVYAPGTFDIDEEARSVVADPNGDDLGQIRVAAQACPTGAIRVTEHA